MDPRRSERLAESLRSELEEIINYELDDPRISSVAVTDVILSPDGRKAHVRLAVSGAAAEQAGCLRAVETAKGFIRHRIGERIELYRLPDLYFDSDLPPDMRAKAPALLRRIRKGRPRE